MEHAVRTAPDTNVRVLVDILDLIVKVNLLFNFLNFGQEVIMIYTYLFVINKTKGSGTNYTI